MKKIMVWIRRLFIKQTKRTGIGLLQALEEYEEQKGSPIWQRMVKTVIEIIYSSPSTFFDSPQNHSKKLKNGDVTKYGLVFKVSTNDFASKTTFVGFAGDKKTGRYAITITLLEDSDRLKPVFIYIFEVSRGSQKSLCKIAAVFQDSKQHDESRSYHHVAEADLVYTGDMAMGLARVFHELTSYPMPSQVASVVGIVGLIESYRYRC